MASGFDLLRLPPGQFTKQQTSLCVKSESGNIWLAPDAEAAERLVSRGVSRGRVWTVGEMEQTAAARTTIAGLLAAAGVAYGDVAVENE